MPGVKTPEQRGVIGAWAYQARQEADLSVEQVAAAITDMGQSVSTATIRGIESGSKKPGAKLLRSLGKVLASTPPDAAAIRSDESDLAAAIRELTAELRDARDARDAYEVRLRALEAEVQSLRVGPAAEGSPAPGAPLASAGSGR